VRSGDWKLVGEKTRVSLFDLSKDISEKNDLAKKIPEKVAELTKLHDTWLAEMATPIRGEAKRAGAGLDNGVKAKNKKRDQKDPERKKKKKGDPAV
jgi:hypothetical protein